MACESGAGPSTGSHLLPEPSLCRTLDLADEDAEDGGWTPTSPASPLEWVKPARAVSTEAVTQGPPGRTWQQP